MIACYLRVSTEDQAENNSVGAQRFKIQCLFAAKGWDYSKAHEYVDEGKSGATMDRPQVQAMLAAIGAGQLTAVVVYDMDRLSRDPDARSAFLMACSARNVQVYELDREVRFHSPEGRLMERVKGSVAEYERARTAQRVRDGVRAAIARGEPWGGARTVDKHGHPIPKGKGRTALTPAEWQQWATRKEREGLTVEAVAQALKVHPVTVRRGLKRV